MIIASLLFFLSAHSSLDLTAAFTTSAFAADTPAPAAAFAQYPVPAESITCHALDFESYFKAQQFKSSILRDKPDLTHPNFAGHYLILKNEFVLETIWLIADCTTGKFFHETLSGNLEFKTDSNLVILIPKSGETSEWNVWSGKDWLKVEPSVATAAESDRLFHDRTGHVRTFAANLAKVR
jgi:hypothetical protein